MLSLISVVTGAILLHCQDLLPLFHQFDHLTNSFVSSSINSPIRIHTAVKACAAKRLHIYTKTHVIKTYVLKLRTYHKTRLSTALKTHATKKTPHCNKGACHKKDSTLLQGRMLRKDSLLSRKHMLQKNSCRGFLVLLSLPLSVC